MTSGVGSAAGKRAPGWCPHEHSVVDGRKSLCALWGRWTNCREVGHCVLDSIAPDGHPVQLPLRQE